MRRADQPAPEVVGSTASGIGLRALAELVRAELRLRLLPALAPAGGAGPLATATMHTEVRRDERRPHRRPAAGPSPSEPSSSEASSSEASSSGAPRSEPPQDAVADEHEETWRLVERAQAGDGEAFGQLYDRYLDTVFRFIYFRVNDRALAEDFTSETFLRALRRISTVNYQGRDIGAWFVTIARNIILDHLKSARHRLEVTTDDTPERDAREPSPEDAVVDLLTSERLMAAVRQLGDEQRECVMLRFIQGFSVSETAAVMGKNDGAIKALQHRAVRKLAELVGGELR